MSQRVFIKLVRGPIYLLVYFFNACVSPIYMLLCGMRHVVTHPSQLTVVLEK